MKSDLCVTVSVKSHMAFSCVLLKQLICDFSAAQAEQ